MRKNEDNDKILKFSEDDSMKMINHFNKAYVDFKNRKTNYEQNSFDDSESYSSDEGLEKDIMDLLNKELSIKDTLQIKKKLANDKKVNAHRKAHQNYKKNSAFNKRLNEMSIFVNKDNSKNSSKDDNMVTDNVKLEDIFADMLKKKN